MKLTLEIRKTVSGYVIAGAVDDKPIAEDVAKTAKQAGLIARGLVEKALGGK